MTVDQTLRSLASPEHAAFNAKLLPTVDAARVLGVRMGDIRATAAALRAGKLEQSEADFLAEPDHGSVEGDLIHMICLNAIRPASQWRAAMETFLPRVDNWMVTDAIDPAILRSKRSEASEIEDVLAAGIEWAGASPTYTVRAGILVLLQALLRGRFHPEHAAAVSTIRHEDYYVHMAAGWYLATVFEKIPDAVRPALDDGHGLDPRVWRVAMRKIVESRKTSPADRAWAKDRRRQAGQAIR